ncbi:MAG: hypothetical protein C5B60_06840 [Chloroflexi bacterium]|nr:MAG: hypothetical protein C5B60_06840 [Chloroflexota bacterium]
MTRPVDHKVYWLHFAEHSDPKTEGLIGVACYLQSRIGAHRREPNCKVPSDFLVTILHRGTAQECFALEAQLRPTPNIGWNILAGGYIGGRGAHPPYRHDKKTRRWMSQSAKERANTPKGRKHMRKAALALNGAGWIGRKHKDSSKQIISRKAKTRCRTPEGRKRMRRMALRLGRGKDHPIYGLIRSAEIRAKISASKKGRRPKLSKAVRKSKAEKMRRHWESPAYRAKMRARSPSWTGEQNPNYGNRAPGRPERDSKSGRFI